MEIFLENITVHFESAKLTVTAKHKRILTGVNVSSVEHIRVIVLLWKNIAFLFKSIKNISGYICFCTLQSLNVFAQVGVL